MASNLPSSPPDRSPPHSAEAEEHVIACCLLDGCETITRAVMAGVRDESFYFPANRLLWEILLDVYSRKSMVNLEMLAEELKERRQLEAVGGFAYLMQVTGKIPTTAHAGYFIEKVIEKAALREAIKQATGLVEKSYSYSGGGLPEHLAPFITSLTDIQSGITSKDECSVQKAADDTIKLVEAMNRGETVKENTVSWGFSDFDRIFYPMMGGELIIIAARPSVGKTTLSDQIALANALRNETDIAIFSLEVTVEQKPRKFAQIMSGHSWRRLPKAHERDRAEFLGALLEIKENKHIHCYYREQTIDGIIARIRVLHQQKKLKCAIIDYLQLIDLGKQTNGRNDAIGEATRRLKLLALELGIPIVLLSQLNRANEREGREPRLSDLRDSGNIEQDADRVLFIDRPATDPITGARQDLTDESSDSFYQNIIQAKGRDVGTYRIGMYFKRSRTTFMQITPNAASH
jgi:replicative DNA helicase